MDALKHRLSDLNAVGVILFWRRNGIPQMPTAIERAKLKNYSMFFLAKGRRHDFKLFRCLVFTFILRLKSFPEDKAIRDAEAASQHYETQRRPTCCPRCFNRNPARERVVIEQVNLLLKDSAPAERYYRNRRRRFDLRCNLIAALYVQEQSA